ncbi:methyltransferase family protein (plasmid) [Mesorhizobium atlanticum]|uniref:methyltransferase family protein n=1 Tax=Mesorhizobium atlanticum TaxID=2233532 RepID=UPI003703E5D5
MAPLWIALLVATKARGFETAAYKLLELVGFALVFSAVLGRVWCAIYIGGRKDRELCRTGPYSLSRNPLYFFSFLGAVGICLAARNPLLAAATAALFLGYYHVIIRAEEQRLEALFAGQYRVWALAVLRFFLSLRIPTQLEEITVNTKTFGRSLLDASWFLFAIIGVELVESSRSTLLGSGWLLPF